jgi:hypothetical protein
MTKVLSVKTSILGLLAISICGLPISAQVDAPKMTFKRPVRFAVSPPLRELAKLPYRQHYFEETEPVHQVNFHPGRILGPAWMAGRDCQQVL